MSNLKRKKTIMNSSQKNSSTPEDDGAQMQKQQKVIYDNKIPSQQDELNEYFYKIKRMGELKKENERLKVHERSKEKIINILYRI